MGGSCSQLGGQLGCSAVSDLSVYKAGPSVLCTVCVCVCESLSHVQLLVTPWTVARQTPLSMEFSRQEYCSGLPFPSPGDLPDPGIKSESSALQADSLPSEPSVNCSILTPVI